MSSQFLRRGEGVSVPELRLMLGAFSRLRAAVVGTSRQVSTSAGNSSKTLLAQNDTSRILTVIASSRSGTQFTAQLDPTQDGNVANSSFSQDVAEGFPATVVLKPGGRLWTSTPGVENFVITEVPS